MDWLVSTFQNIGAALGFIVAGIAVVQHVTKRNPIAIIVGEPLGGFGQRSTYLRFSNPSDRPILLFIPGGKYPNQFTVWPDDKTASAIYGVVESVTTLCIDPGETRLLPLLKPRNFEEVEAANQIECILTWNFAQPVMWTANRKTRVTITKRAFQALEAGLQRQLSE